MKFQIIFIILIIFSKIILSTADLPPLPFEFNKMKNSFLSCTLNLVNKYFPQNETIAYSLPATRHNTSTLLEIDEDFLNNLHEISHWTIFLKRYSNTYKLVAVNRKKTNNYIIHIQNSDELLRTIKYLKISQWNPQAKFLIFILKVYEDPNPVVLKIAKILWNYHIINAVIFIARYNDTSIIDIYTWFPYHNGNCGKNITETILLDTCYNGKYNNESVDLFPQKIPLDMMGCPVIVRTVLWPPFVIPPPNLDRNVIGINFTEGIEIQMMNAIAKAANFTVVYTISDKIQNWGFLYENGTASGGLFKQLLDENVDIGLAALAATNSRYNYLDFTNSYGTESVTWCVPIAKEEDRWISLIQILQLYTWIATIVSFLVIGTIIWRISLIVPEESQVFKNLSTCYLYTFSTTLCVTIKTLPKNMYVRMVLVMWVMYSYTLCSAYTTSLISKLTQPEFEKQIKTMDEIFKSDMKFGYLNGLQIYFEDKSNSIDKKIIEEGVACENAGKCLQRVANDRDFAFILSRDYLQYVSRAYYDKTGRLKIYWFKSDTVSYPIQMFCYKGFPLIGRINELTLRIKSGGFMKKWLSDTILSYMKNKKHSEDEEGVEEEKEQVLKFEHMQGPFLLLIFGLGLSTIAFIGEIIHYKVHTYIKNKNK